MRVSNKNCRKCVESLLPFKASNLSATNEENIYVVWSYKWYPILAYVKSKDQWYINSDRYSYSTSKQLSYATPLNHPSYSRCMEVSHRGMDVIVESY